jgi:hypothetical protein
VLRFWNSEIYDDLDAVEEAIHRACASSPHPLAPADNVGAPGLCWQAGTRGPSGSPRPHTRSVCGRGVGGEGCAVHGRAVLSCTIA